MLTTNLLDFGAQGDGTTDDSAALIAAFASGLPVAGGGPQFTYKVTRAVTITTSFYFDGQGCVIKPVGNTPALVHNSAPVTAYTTVRSGAKQGSRQVAVASASSIAVGQYAYITADDAPSHDAQSYPDYWGKVTNVSGATITLDRPLPVDYSGTIYYSAISASAMLDHAVLRNVVFDGSACVYTTALGQGARLGGFVRTLVEGCRFVNFANNSTRTEALTVLGCLDATVRDCVFAGQSAGNQQGSIYYSRNALFTGCTVDGSAFGLGITRCENATASDNFLQGRRKQESDESITARSTRGIKVYGCAVANVVNNHTSDFESGIKVQACFRYDLRGNVVRNAGLTGAYTGAIALNVGSIARGTNMSAGVIAHNIVENSGGVGIGVTSDAPGGVIISGNQVLHTAGAGIYADVRDAIIQGNRVVDWGLRNAGDVGIHFGAGATVTGNRLSHSTLTNLNCLRSVLAPGGRYHIEGNVSESGNPPGATS